MWGRTPSSVLPGEAWQRMQRHRRVPHPCPCVLYRDRVGILTFGPNSVGVPFVVQSLKVRRSPESPISPPARENEFRQFSSGPKQAENRFGTG